MRHLVGFFLSAGVLVGCSVTEVGSMDPVEGRNCSVPGETATLSDMCTVCVCGETTWSCDDSACDPPCMGDDCNPPCMGDDCNPPCMGDDCNPPCMGDDCTPPPVCEPGDLMPGEGGCFNCSCDETGQWVCPEIACDRCVEGEMTGTECYECVCNAEGTWSCMGFFDGICAPDECIPGETLPAGDDCNTCFCSMDGTLMCTMIACDGTCAFGNVDCNADPSDGCETDTLTSTQNCGACGVTCTAPVGAMAECIAGVCVTTGDVVCEPGLADCDGDRENGCETDVSSSVENCGACGLPCMAAMGDTAVCNMGQCGLASAGCQYRGVEYEVGAEFPARDGCNSCQCLHIIDEGLAVACTTLACECNPMNESHYRGYLLTDPAECTGPIPCPPFTAYFTNECGCGCEQAEDCPDTYPCAGDGSMDMMCTYLRERCPYSEAIVE